MLSNFRRVNNNKFQSKTTSTKEEKVQTFVVLSFVQCLFVLLIYYCCHCWCLNGDAVLLLQQWTNIEKYKFYNKIKILFENLISFNILPHFAFYLCYFGFWGNINKILKTPSSIYMFLKFEWMKKIYIYAALTLTFIYVRVSGWWCWDGSDLSILCVFPFLFFCIWKKYYNIFSSSVWGLKNRLRNICKWNGSLLHQPTIQVTKQTDLHSYREIEDRQKGLLFVVRGKIVNKK